MPTQRTTRVVNPATNENRGLRLVSYADKKYSTIRVGTLECFREMEGTQADPLDGRIEGLKLSGPTERMRSETFNEVMRESNIRIVARDGISIGSEGSVADSASRVCPNLYVFCCSMEFGAIPASQRSSYFGAGFCSVIRDPESFCNEIGGYLLANGRDADGERFDRKFHCIQGWHAPVAYVDRRPAKISTETDNLELFVFQKEAKFRIEQEYRFAWAVFNTVSDEQVWVDREPIYVPVEQLSLSLEGIPISGPQTSDNV